MRRTIERLRAEFVEMPGLRLNAKQVQRLCGVDERLCQGALDALVDVRFLRVGQNGVYARRVDETANDVDRKRDNTRIVIARH